MHPLHQHSYPQQFLLNPMVTNPSPNIDNIDLTIHSSPPSEIDTVDRLSNYLEWLKGRNCSQASMLAEVQVTLFNTCHNFNTVSTLTDAQFIMMKILEGIAMLLRMNINRFKRSETLKKV